MYITESQEVPDQRGEKRGPQTGESVYRESWLSYRRGDPDQPATTSRILPVNLKPTGRSLESFSLQESNQGKTPTDMKIQGIFQ